MSSTTFDYVTAWHRAAYPLYQALPESVHVLLATVAVRCADVHQLADCSMPWPDGDNAGADSLRAAFEAIDSDTLALAASVCWAVGHWYPGKSANGADVPGRESGAYWKFAHYADQVLRERLGLPARGDNGRSRGFGYAVHEGEIRVTRSTLNGWNWERVAPATPAGMEHARKVRAQLCVTDKRRPRDIENAIYRNFETLRATPKSPDVWSDAWRQLDYAQYMVDQQECERRELARKPAADFDAMIARLEADHARKVAELRTGVDGHRWLLEHRQPIDNVIYYPSRGLFSWGWRTPLSPESVSIVLGYISEFPYAYEIKQVNGPTLSGGIG